MTVEVLTEPPLLKNLVMTLQSASVSVQALPYNLDRAGIVSELCSRSRSGVETRFILVAKQLKPPGCSQQRLRLPTLVEWVWSAMHGHRHEACASLHAKAWVVDNRMMFVGSNTATSIGLENDLEVSLKTYGEISSRKCATLFLDIWDKAWPLDSAANRTGSAPHCLSRRRVEHSRRANRYLSPIH